MQGRGSGSNQLRRGLDDREAGSHCVFLIMLMRSGVAEIGKNTIAHVLGDEASIAPDQRRAALVIGGDNPAHIFRIEPRRHRGRTNEIAEHHSQLTAFGGVVRLRLDLGGWLTRGALPIDSAETGDRLKQPFPVAHEHAELFEISVGKIW
jgi:hypothetical protein